MVSSTLRDRAATVITSKRSFPLFRACETPTGGWKPLFRQNTLKVENNDNNATLIWLKIDCIDLGNLCIHHS
mgnify:FL=1